MTSIYFQRLNEKTLSRRRHVRAVIQRHLGKELSAKDREQASDAYLESYEGHSFSRVRNENLKNRIENSVAHIDAETMESILKLKKSSSEPANANTKGKRRTEIPTTTTPTKININPYTQKPMVQGHGLTTVK